VEFTGIRPVNAAMGRYWLGAVHRFRHGLLAHDPVITSPLLHGQALRSVVIALLHTFPNTFLDRAQTPPRRPSPGSARVRRAVAYIEAHLAEDIGLAEIAQAARMSPRGLQAAFRREKDTTPLGYLRAARLAAAHRDLVAADPTTGATVESVAAAWGFTHRGRFAAAYRDRYGRSPATTLRA
jgi:transcriptional regulator GlxA family with amidase domain